MLSFKEWLETVSAGTTSADIAVIPHRIGAPRTRYPDYGPFSTDKPLGTVSPEELVGMYTAGAASSTVDYAFVWLGDGEPDDRETERVASAAGMHLTERRGNRLMSMRGPATVDRLESLRREFPDWAISLETRYNTPTDETK